MAILEELAVALKLLRGPWIVGGDWNVFPGTLAASRWPDMVNGKIYATSLATCNDETYDFFVVHNSISHAVAGVQRLDDGGCSPHWTTRLFIKGDARRYAVRQLCKPPIVTAALPQGPQARPPPYDKVLEHVKKQEADLAMLAWYRTARNDWSALIGTKLQHRAACFHWRPAAGLVAKPWAGTTALSNMWRVMAQRAVEVSRFLEAGFLNLRPTQLKVLTQHLTATAAAASALCNSQRLATEPHVVAWALSLRTAVSKCAVGWAKSLATMASIKAKKLEDIANRARTTCWKAAIGAASATKAPTKLQL